MNIDPRLLARAKEDSWKVLYMDVLACVLATLSFKTAIAAGIVAPGAGHAGMVFVLVVSTLLTVRRIRCLHDLQRCSTALQKGVTAFGTLADAEDAYERAAH